MLIDGHKIAAEILSDIRQEVGKLPFIPVFCDILVGDSNGPSAQYVSMKAKTAEKVGFKFRQANFPQNITTSNLITEITKINQEQNLCGLIVQLPLPDSLNTQMVLNAINPFLDVDCLGIVNSNLFYKGQAVLEFPTALAVMKVLDATNLDLTAKKILIIGQGQLVGRPVGFLLKSRGLNYMVATGETKNLSFLIGQSDIIISAAGQPGLVRGGDIKPGAVIIDAGTSESYGGIVGDVDFKSVQSVASILSPVPGGVGPVTVAMLLNNVLMVAKSLVK